MKFYLLVFLFLLLTPGLFAQIICGDVNSDYNVNIIDALMVAQYYIGLPSTMDTGGADVNADGSITIVDALMIAQFYVGLRSGLNCAQNPAVDVSGTWTSDSHINLGLTQDQYIFDHTIQDWTGYVILTGYMNDAIMTNAAVSRYTVSMAVGGTILLTTQEGIYPYYECTLKFSGHSVLYLQQVTVLIVESENESKNFELSMNSYNYSWETNRFTYTLENIPSLDGPETLSLDFEILRNKTLLLESGTIYKMPYPRYDEIYSLEISGNSFHTGFIYQTDIVVLIDGTVSVSGFNVVLDFAEPWPGIIQPPIVLEAFYADDGSPVLERQVIEPSEEDICEYYGIEDSNLLSYDYNQYFIRLN